MSTTSFAELYAQSLGHMKIYPGAIVPGKVLEIGDDYVTVSVGLKSEGYIPIAQFRDADGELEISVGDAVDVAVEALENGSGETRLSRERAKRSQAWDRLADAFAANETVIGYISSKVKGGFTVELESIRAFLPGSLVDARQAKDLAMMEGRELEFKIIKLDQKRNNVVVSRRSIMDGESSAEREELLNNLHEGQTVTGLVKNLTDYGAFVDLGGIDGLLHITDMAWKRVKHPSEVVSVGQEVRVKVLKFDREKTRVSLGLKQLGEDPWVDIKGRYVEGTRLRGKVTNVTDYGCFVEIEEGVEGLVHVSEMDWTNKNIHPSKVVQLGHEVDVMILEIDEERRRISLGLKQCQVNPWVEFERNHQKGDRVSGAIKSITDFGIFIGLDGGIDGLIHLSDISWTESGENVVRQYKRGQELEAVILAIDSERERISLGIKQLHGEPENSFELFTKGQIVSGDVIEVQAKSVTIELAPNVIGTIKASEMSKDKVDDASSLFKVGDRVESKILTIDKKTKAISLSIKAKDIAEEKDALRELANNDDRNTTLGDLFKDKITGKDQD